MDILVHADGFRMSDTLRDAVVEKIGRLEHYAPRALRARVNLRRVSSHTSSSQFQATVLVEVPGQDLSAQEKATQPLECVDLLTEKIERRLMKRKTAKLAKRTQGAREREALLAAAG